MERETKPDSTLYQTIHSQPETTRLVIEGTIEEVRRAGEILLAARRVLLVGTGTSSHAAVVGEHLLRMAGIDARATTNFDFVNYGTEVKPEDAVVAISHRGGKRYGRLAIERALKAGAKVVGITRKDSPTKGLQVKIPTIENEVSATHTASYTSAIAVLALLAVRVGNQRGTDMKALQDAVRRLSAAMSKILDEEEEVWPVAERLAEKGRLILVGAGPNAVTAREGALKVKESSYLVAEGFELETSLHGGLQAVEAGDVATVVAADGPSLERLEDLVGALRIIGARIFLVCDERVASRFPVEGVIREGGAFSIYPAVPEQLSPALAVIPLQLLAAFTAQLRGTNADSFRRDDPTYRRAIESYEL